MIQTIKTIECNGSAKGHGDFKFLVPSKETFVEAGFSEVAAENFEYLLKCQLGTHQLKEQFKRDSDIVSGERSNVSDTDRILAEERMEEAYSYDFSSSPKQRSSSKWGDLKDYIPLAVAHLGKGASDDELRERASLLKAHMETGLFQDGE